MKVAISVPDMGKSRSQLYAEALARYVEVNQGSVVTEQLNALYALQPAELDLALQAAHFQVLAHETW